MDRNTILRWLFIAVASVGLYFLFNKSCNKSSETQPLPEEHYVNAPGFVPDVIDPPTGEQHGPWNPPEGEICTIRGNRYEAELSSRGAGIKHFRLLDKRYAESDAADLSTTPDVERWRSLRTTFRGSGGDDQVKYDRFNWKLRRIGADASNPASAGTGCEFTYEDTDVRIVKTVTAGERPFELNVDTKVTNLAENPRSHRLGIEVFAFRLNKEMKGKLGRVSPFQTDLSCAAGNDVERKEANDSAFKTGWWSKPLIDRYTAVANYYFAQALVPTEAPAGEKPECALLAESWYSAGQAPDDDEAAKVFHARFAYPARSLTHGETASYQQIAFFGPKEREVLRHAAGGAPRLGDLINLGFFSIVAKVLVAIISWIHAHITFGNWGLAIIVTTIGIRILLFPLMWQQIKATIGMRKLKPELDALNEKFKDDAQAKGLATMELYRKHKVNPLGGCLPQLATMPVWFAMYTTLQTAVEFYHTRFLWFTDLSAPDKFYILPIVLGGFMILQQRIVPQQGMDPMQQKMMTWLLPGIFTVMMLFLPAALGVYMLTNSILGIVQQLAVERFAPRAGGGGKKNSDIVVKPIDDVAGGGNGTFGKGKARV